MSESKEYAKEISAADYVTKPYKQAKLLKGKIIDKIAKAKIAHHLTNG